MVVFDGNLLSSFLNDCWTHTALPAPPGAPLPQTQLPAAELSARRGNASRSTERCCTDTNPTPLRDTVSISMY